MERFSDAHITPLEFILECRGLVAMTAKDRVPRASVQVSVVNTHTHTLTHHCCTEIAEGSSDPVFLTGVCFHDDQPVDWDTRMKLTVYHCKDPAHNKRMFLGFTSFSIRDLFRSQEPSISLSLRTQDGERGVGEVNVSRLQMEELQDGEDPLSEDTSTCLSGHKCALLCDCLHGSIHDTDNSPMMRAVLRNTLCKVYRFQTAAGCWMLVREQMSESSLSFSIPKQLLALLIQQHMKRVQELEHLGDLSPHWEGLRSDVIAYHNQLITSYQDTLTNLNTHAASSCFKPSTSRTDRNLQFVPVNLHAQRMQVTSPGNTGVWYEVITVGAAADHCQGFKHGGLQRLLSARSVCVSSEQSSRARELLGSVSQLRGLLCGQAEELLQASLELRSSLLLRALDRLAATTGQFVHVLKDDLVRSSLLALHTTSPAHPSDGHASVTTANGTLNRRSSNQVAAPSLRQRDSTHQDMEYDEEEWDRVWANVAKSLNCIVAMVDRLQERTITQQEVMSEGSTDNTKNTGWRVQLLPLVVTLQDCVGEAEAWVRPAVTASLLQGEHRCCPGAPVTQRRDAVFSQTLSALVCGVCMRVYSGLQDQLFLQQLHLLGVLVQYEGLLSTYGDEQGVLEDMEVGVMDLNRVSFSFSLATSDLPCSLQPCLSCPRGDDIVVQVPLPPDAFAALPWQLRDGQLVRVHPVFFNIGINQQQSLAERFGDSSVQDRINQRSFDLLKVYYNTLKKILPSVCGVQVEEVEEVLGSLQVSLQSRKRKNTDVLWLAAQVCRALRGVRLTSCKSAKDRTSMSVTLEQVRVLSQQHNLSLQHFPRALDCMRREGCRMENVQKNICSRKYAFNSLQLLTFPRLYRPPEGTYGSAGS